MRTTITLALLLIGLNASFSQSKDSVYFQRIDDRIEAMMDHFTTEVSSDSALYDTVRYVQKLLASHIESSKLRTKDERFLSKIYAYALQLRNERFERILGPELCLEYEGSFKQAVNGFAFCRVCRYAWQPGAASCGNCGEPGRD